MNKKCYMCSELFYKKTSDSKKYWSVKRFCGFKCVGMYNRRPARQTKSLIKKGDSGDKSIRWKGGEHRTSQGYIEQYISPGVYQLQHRYVMEQHIGRKLQKNEHVHHLNHDKTDNRIENLQILDIKDHGRMHSIERWQKARA